MNEEATVVYCDGSISKSTLEGPHTSHFANHVGRAMVIAPALDVGSIFQFDGNLTLPSGHENALYGEIVAIKEADAFRTERRIQGFKIYSDNNDAIIGAELSGVELIPYNRLNVANEYLRSILSYASYSRGSEGTKRRTPSPKRREVLRLMNTSRDEFRLSESKLYPTYQAKAKRESKII